MNHQALLDIFHAVKPPDAEERPVGGSPAAVVAGNLFMRVRRDELVLRLGESARRELLAMEGARQFEAIPGRPMAEYVVVPETIITDRMALSEWVKRSHRYAMSLAPQEQSGIPQAAPQRQVTPTRQMNRVDDDPDRRR